MPSSTPDIDRLIGLYLSHRASESEKRQLEAWLQVSSDNRKVFEHLEKLWSVPSGQDDTSDSTWIRDQIWQAGTGKQLPALLPTRRNKFPWRKMAAVVVLGLLGAWLYFSLTQEDAAQLPATIALVEKANPAGQRSTHQLPDGTLVSLNAASRLVYPEKFADTLRWVRLNGEAFFDVAKDVQRPFVVEAAGTRTQALGTAFNIQAYAEEDTIKIALLEGSVRVGGIDQSQTAILSPGQELHVARGKQEFRQQPFNYESTFGWKEGLLVFEEADFAQFCNTIEKWYGVKVEVEGTPPTDWQVRARYQREDLRHVLRDVCFNKNINFKLEDKNVLLTF